MSVIALSGSHPALPPNRQSHPAAVSLSGSQNSALFGSGLPYTTALPTPDSFLSLSRQRGSRPAATAIENDVLTENKVKTSREKAIELKDQGNNYRARRLESEAIQTYHTAILTDPTYADAYYNYAQLMDLLADKYKDPTYSIPYRQKAVDLLVELLSKADPGDHDARVMLGEYLEKQGRLLEAKKRYLEVLNVQYDFDPAKRRLEHLLYRDQQQLHPEITTQIMAVKYKEVVSKSRELLKQFFTQHHNNPVLLRLSQEVPIVFEKTEQFDVSSNIAEWDADRGVIRLNPMAMFSSPNVVAAYLVHELWHAVDADGQSSIEEEKRAYRLLAKFWSLFQGAENDPNLDRSLALFRQGGHALDQEVERVYRIQNPDLPDFSPGNGLPSQHPQVLLSDAYEAFYQGAPALDVIQRFPGS